MLLSLLGGLVSAGLAFARTHSITITVLPKYVHTCLHMFIHYYMYVYTYYMNVFTPLSSCLNV
jgi:hypothetical protein